MHWRCACFFWCLKSNFEKSYSFLAHLSQRFRMSYCDRLQSIVCNPSSIHVFENPGPIFFKLYVEPSVKGGLKIVQMVTVHKLRWPFCPYMVKTLKNLLKNQESFKAEYYIYSIRDSRATKFVQMMIIVWLLTFLRQGQICIPMHLYGENVLKKKIVFSKYSKDFLLKLAICD